MECVGIRNSSSVKNRIAVHFVYDWKMRNERYVEFECMDVFELDKHSEKIEKLTIIYDSRQTRDEFDNLSPFNILTCRYY
jgi:hypothetical protein